MQFIDWKFNRNMCSKLPGIILIVYIISYSSAIQDKVIRKREAMEEFVLFDFTKLPNLHGWSEMSDVVREVGMSKAVLVLQKTQRFQRGVLFTMLNPQPNGAGFAGFRTDTELDLSDYNTLRLHCRGQGENYGYKVVLRHKNENTEPFPSYEQMFQAPNRKFETVDLPLAGFEPYYRGKKQNQSAPLDKSQITNFEFQIYGGVYLPVKQAGTSSLEIDWVKAVP
ncbi:uncharacterized protein LOC124364338 isoform X1 [Homalodisca vitripennis]|uniref:uncharacterized protein LOC124364338 isoform X1 n=1 Tax=Homalodisca vitripennis TaxID=197043 RepID=UPI001EECD308|nr:uncharacterized protein LOC124364338 isoform X1 [Homalodisca vitripennis]